MFVFRILRRIHRPFLLLIFGCSSFFILTNVSVALSTVRTVDTPGILSMEDFESRIIRSMVIEDDVKCDETCSESGGPGLEEDLVPVPTVHQLPFCGSATKFKKKIPPQSQDVFENQEYDKINETRNEEIVFNEHGFKVGKQIVVATLDGRLSLLDYAGKILWSVCTGHLFSSTISSLQLSDRGKFIKLIPSLTGGLYKYDGESLQAMPLNADSLLQRSFKLAQDVVITGGKELRTFGVDIDSGLVKYECGISGCKSPTTAEFTSEEDSSGIVLVIKKQLQTVRAIDSTTGVERWNFSVGTHELALAGLTDGCYEPADKNSHPENSDNSFRMIIPDGVVFGTDPENKATWKHKFDSPISQAWLLEDSHLQIVDPIKASVYLQEPPSLYVGMHKQQLYVQESHTTAKRLTAVMELEEGNRSDFTMEPLQIGWRRNPQPITPAITDENHGEPNTASKALAPLYLGPFFVYERDEIKSTNPLAIEAPAPPSSGQTYINDEDIEEINGNGDSVDMTVIVSLATLWFWWKEILGISLLTAIILNIILLRPVVYLTRKRTIREVVQQFNLFLSRNRNNQQLALPSPHTRISTSSGTLEPTSPSPTNNNRIRTISNSSVHSTHSEEQGVHFVSQYLKDFEPVQCLGRGAFGTVFEAKKKIDDRSYAVKRISLPNREKSRDRVMREVKSLARLDHKNIVRYFNAWIENPPQGWLEKNDPLWNACHLNSPSPTYENYTSSDVFSKASIRDQSLMTSRKDHSEIFVLDKTPDRDGDDSFIVFESESGRHDPTESGIMFDSSKASTSDTSEDFVEEDCDWLDDKSEQKELLPLHVTPTTESILNVSETRSKFFHRPTTLNIPSSSDVTEDKNSWDERPNEKLNGDPHSIMYLYIQQELCQKRTLQDWLRHEKTRNFKHVMGMFAQLVEAVEYIHSNKLIHRDLKPGNIFLAGGTGSSDGDQITVKIGDFGLATTLAGSDINKETPDGTRVVLDMEPTGPSYGKLTGLVGTQLYMAPEQFEMKVYNHKVDIFSLGFIFFELLVPFSTDMEKYNELHNLRQLKFPLHFNKSNPDQCELIQEMISHDPNARPDASNIKVYLSKYLHETTIRSQSYPEPFVLEDTNQTRRKSNVRRTQDKDSRLIYKTHSAM